MKPEDFLKTPNGAIPFCSHWQSRRTVWIGADRRWYLEGCDHSFRYLEAVMIYASGVYSMNPMRRPQ